VEHWPTLAQDSGSSMQETGARLPSRASTTSRAVTRSGGRARRYPPLAPRTERMKPARRSWAAICSR
jgi:hypothetical protein